MAIKLNTVFDPADEIIRRRLLLDEKEGEGEGGGGEGEGEGGGEDEGGSDASWRAGLEGDHLKVAERFNSLPDMAQAVIDFRKSQSTAIQIPGEDADDEAKDAFYKKLGRPDSPDAYEFPDPPEGTELSDEDKALRSKAAQVFFERGYTADQARAAIELFSEITSEGLNSIVEADKTFAEETEAELKRKWGADYEENQEFANRAANTLLGDRLEEARHMQTASGRYILDHPVFVEMFARLGRNMQEGTNLGGPISQSARDSLQEKIDKLQEDIDTARARGDRDRAQRLYTEQQGLYEQLTGEAGRAA